MHYVHVTVVRWVGDEWPGWVEVHLDECDGTTRVLIDKVPLFDYGDVVVPGVEFPVELAVPCDVLATASDRAGHKTSVVRLHFDIEDQHGRSTFRVDADAISSRP
jgi:hypothetical protein